LILSKGPRYPHATLVEGNLVFNNGGRGIHVLKSDNVTVRYNTCWHNNRCRLDGTWKQGERESDGSAIFRAEDNIAAGNTNAWSAALALHSFGPTLPMVLKNNLLFGAREVNQQVALASSCIASTARCKAASCAANSAVLG
jgi:parallel beta-helix repeat protein